MKRIFIFIFAILSLNNFAQIRTIEPKMLSTAEKEIIKEFELIPYDSMLNISPGIFKTHSGLIGQKLYFTNSTIFFHKPKIENKPYKFKTQIIGEKISTVTRNKIPSFTPSSDTILVIPHIVNYSSLDKCYFIINRFIDDKTISNERNEINVLPDRFNAYDVINNKQSQILNIKNGNLSVPQIIYDNRKKYVGNTGPIIELVNEQTKDTVYFQYPRNADGYVTKGIISVGFYEKLSQILIGEKFRFSHINLNKLTGAYDELTKTLIEKENIKSKSFTCTDVVVIDDKIVVILESDTEKIGVKIENITNYSSDDYFYNHNTKEAEYKNLPVELHTISRPKMEFGYFGGFTSKDNMDILDKYCIEIEGIISNYNNKKEVERKALIEKERKAYQSLQETKRNELTARFGAEYGIKVYNRQVAIGMTKDMCREAWGHPDKSQVNNNDWEAWYYISPISGSVSRIIFNKGKVIELFN